MKKNITKISIISFFISYSSLLFSEKSFANEKVTVKKIKHSSTLKVCTSGGFIPFSIFTNDGWIGFDIDLAKGFSNYMKVDLDVINYSFDGIIPALITRKCDLIISGMTITEDRKKTVLFSNPYFKDGLSYMFKKSNKKINSIKNIDQLNSKSFKIGVKIGYTSDFYVSKNLKKALILRYNETADIINSLINNKIDIIITDTNHANIIQKKFSKILESKKTKVQEEYFGVAARHDAQDLIKEFNSFLVQWKKEGEYEKNYNKYF